MWDGNSYTLVNVVRQEPYLMRDGSTYLKVNVRRDLIPNCNVRQELIPDFTVRRKLIPQQYKFGLKIIPHNKCESRTHNSKLMWDGSSYSKVNAKREVIPHGDWKMGTHTPRWIWYGKSYVLNMNETHDLISHTESETETHFPKWIWERRPIPSSECETAVNTPTSM